MKELFFWYVLASLFKIFDLLTTLRSPNILKDEKNIVVLNELQKADSPKRKLVELTIGVLLVLTIFLILSLVQEKYVPSEHSLAPLSIYFFQFIAGLHVSVTCGNIFFLYFTEHKRKLNITILLLASLISFYFKIYFFLIGWLIEWKFEVVNKQFRKIL